MKKIHRENLQSNPYSKAIQYIVRTQTHIDRQRYIEKRDREMRWTETDREGEEEKREKENI